MRALIRDGVPTRLLVIGDGPMRAELTRRAAGLPVRFLGHLDRASVAHIVSAADAMVAPAPAETFGLAILEALACGTPAVVPDQGAAPELVIPGAGITTDGTPQALADGVRELLARPEPDRRAGALGRAEQFPWDSTVAGLLTLHRALPAHGPASP